MDHANLFDTRITSRLHRLEYLAAMIVCAVLILVHIGQIRLLVGVALFAYIDVVGYLPGLFRFLRSPDGHIPIGYYVAYNVTHSVLSMGLVAGLWAWLVRPEWALLAIPLHLCIDRGFFGNSLKSFSVSFEPRLHPAFQDLTTAITKQPRWAGTTQATNQATNQATTPATL